MVPNKKSGRILGLLLLVSAIPGAIGTSMRGLSGADTDTTQLLLQVVENSEKMNTAIQLDMLSNALAVVIALFLFPWMKKHNSRLAMGYTGTVFSFFIIIAVSNILHLMLLSISADYAANPGTADQSFITMAKMLYEGYYWTHFLVLMLYSMTSFMMHYFLFKTRLVPGWLAIWGLLASVIVFSGGALQMADIKVSMLFFIQNGICMLTFIGWLLAVGFNPEHLQKQEVQHISPN